MNNHYDIIIIGTGSGGSTMAYKLAPSGKRILILERGGFIPKEKENLDANEFFCSAGALKNSTQQPMPLTEAGS